MGSSIGYSAKDALLTNEYNYNQDGLWVLLAVPVVRERGLMVTTPRQSVDGDRAREIVVFF